MNDPTRRDALKTALAVITATPLALAKPSEVKTLNILPYQPKILGVRVQHFDTITGPETLIARNVENPGSCRMCPRDKCDARGGFCVVRVKSYVPDCECATFTWQ